MAHIIFYTDVTEVPRGDDGIGYEAVSWVMERPYAANLEERIARDVEAWRAVAQQESYAEAAAEARRQRDRLLQESDTAMLLDRMGLSVPDNITATTLLSVARSFFGALRQSIDGDTARYRQALRDLPAASGFPFNITWPKKPVE